MSKNISVGSLTHSKALDQAAQLIA